MNLDAYLLFVSGEKPFLDPQIRAFPGSVARTAMLPSIVQWVAKEKGEKPIRILEIGSWMGSSTLAWVEGLTVFHQTNGQIFCADLWGQNKTTEYQPGQVVYKSVPSTFAYDVFSYNMRVSNCQSLITRVIGDSIYSLSGLRDNWFDIIYIDGSHRYDVVAEDIRNARRLITDGGIICGDDLELEIDQCDPTALEQQKNQDQGHDPLNNQAYHPGVTLAVAEAFGPVNPFIGLWALRGQGEEFAPFDLSVLPRRIPSFFPDYAANEARRVLNI